jgi:hypothetical protein
MANTVKFFPFSANHGSDVAFLQNGPTSSSSSSEQGAIDRDLSSIMIQLWTNFIHRGSPEGVGVDWPQWREESGRQLVLFNGEDSGSVSVIKGYRQRQWNLWNDILPIVASSSSSSKKCPLSTSTRASSLVKRGGFRKQPIVYKDVEEAHVGARFFTNLPIIIDDDNTDMDQ